MDVLEELLPAQNQSYVLGLKLKIPPYVVEGIVAKHSDPRDRLLHVLLESVEQAKPRLTWRVIVGALRSPAVNLPQLAERVKAAHFPDFSATRGDVPSSPELLVISVLFITHMHIIWSSVVDASLDCAVIANIKPVTVNLQPK